MITDSHINSLLREIAATNSEKAYRALYVGMYPGLLAFAHGILKSHEDAEEVVSDLFINIWQKRTSLPLLDKPKLYFFMSTRNGVFNKLKSNKRSATALFESWSASVESVFFNPEELMFSKEFTAKIMESVNQLPPKCRVIFKLIKEDGLRYGEVAQLLDISIKTVEGQMAIALRRLKHSLEFSNQFPEIHSLLVQKK